MNLFAGDPTDQALELEQFRDGQAVGAPSAIVARKIVAIGCVKDVVRADPILNTEKMETTLKGSALVSFAIGESGFLTSVSIRKSSGTLELDELAVDHIRRAAPFPPPPPGARQRFTIEFAGN